MLGWRSADMILASRCRLTSAGCESGSSPLAAAAASAAPNTPLVRTLQATEVSHQIALKTCNRARGGAKHEKTSCHCTSSKFSQKPAHVQGVPPQDRNHVDTGEVLQLDMPGEGNGQAGTCLAIGALPNLLLQG